VNFIGKTPWRGLQGAIGLAWPILGRLGRLDPGSNPGSPTLIRYVWFIRVVLFHVPKVDDSRIEF
jgi:hypothetical protein